MKAFVVCVLVFICASLNAQKLNYLARQLPENQQFIASDLENTLLTSDNEPIVITRSYNDYPSQFITSDDTLDLQKNAYHLFRLNDDGGIVWHTRIYYDRLDGNSFIVLPTYRLDEDDNILFSIASRSRHRFNYNDVTGPVVGEVSDDLDNITTFIFDKNGDYVNHFQFKVDGDLWNFHDWQIRDGKIYYLYNLDQGESGDPDCFGNFLETHIQVKDYSGANLQEKTFSAYWDGGGDGASNCGFMLYYLAPDQDGNVYLSGYLNGQMTTDLSPELRIENVPNQNARYNALLVKLNGDLDFEWHRALPAAIGSVERPQFMSNGDVAFYVTGVNGKVYEMSGTDLSLRIRDFIITDFSWTNYFSLTLLDPDGEPKWVNFFEHNARGFTIDNEDVIWVGLSETTTLNSSEYYYYDRDLNPVALTNPRDERKWTLFGYMKINPGGTYHGHGFVKNLGAGNWNGFFSDRYYLMPKNDECGGFFLGSNFGGPFDMTFTDSEEHIIESRTLYWDSFFARYGNSKPKASFPDIIAEHCSETTFLRPVAFEDESVSELTYRFTSSDESVLPSDSLSIQWIEGSPWVKIRAGAGFGQTTITLEVTDVCGEVGGASFDWDITEGVAAPVINAGVKEYDICEGGSILLTTDMASVVWSDGSTGAELLVETPGEYWAKVIKENGCESQNSDTISVSVFSNPIQPTVAVEGDLAFCQGDSVQLISDLSENIIWSTGDTTRRIAVYESGTYTVRQVTENCGESDWSLPVNVTVYDIPEKPLITIDGDLRICENGSVVLRASEADTYLWSTGATTREITVNESGSFWLSSTTNGCESPASDVVDILVDENFDLFMVADTSVCSAFNTIELIPEASLPELDFEWSDGSGMNTLQIDEAGHYWVEVSNGTCIQKAYVRVQEVCYPILYVPTAFSPNGDRSNDTFHAKGTRIISFGINIFNQWGVKVFTSSSMNIGWDGRFENEEAPEGQYVYHIVYSGLINDQIVNLSKRGAVMLLR